MVDSMLLSGLRYYANHKIIAARMKKMKHVLALVLV